MTDLAVHFEGVSKRYPHFLLDNIDLELPAGGIMGFIGANGAGKSTTIRILMGLVHPDRGAVHVLTYSMPKEQAAAKLDIGFVSEEMRLYESATLAWHMEFIRPIYPRWDQRYAESLLRRFDLKPQQKIKGLSHGQRVKAALLLALARRPRLLVLDEPTTGLDPVARQEVLTELMAVLADEDRTILFSSHNTLDVEQISDQITFIERGRIIDSANKEIFLDRWRRLRLVLPPNAAVPRMPGIIDVGGSNRLPVLTTNNFDPAMLAVCQDTGIAVQAVDTMTLEEIFVANVQKGGSGSMNYFLVKHLVLKDWYLNRRMMVASLVTSALTFVAIAAAGGSNISIIFGVIVLATILIGMGAVIMTTIVMERKQQTLPFVMSLPISYFEYTTSKVLGSLLLFLVLWSAMLVGTVVTILSAPGFSPGLVPFVIIMLMEILVSTCLITTVAVTTASQGWTIGVTQVGGLGLNGVGYYVAPQVSG